MTSEIITDNLETMLGYQLQQINSFIEFYDTQVARKGVDIRKIRGLPNYDKLIATRDLIERGFGQRREVKSRRISGYRWLSA